jgi:hypothetical protein
MTQLHLEWLIPWKCFFSTYICDQIPKLDYWHLWKIIFWFWANCSFSGKRKVLIFDIFSEWFVTEYWFVISTKPLESWSEVYHYWVGLCGFTGKKIYPLVTNGYYSTRQLCNNFKEYRVLSVHCKKLLEGLAWISAFRSKKLYVYLFTLYTTHFTVEYFKV